MEKPTCRTCPYWDGQYFGEDGEDGVCRHRSPIPIIIDACEDPSQSACWPATYFEHWCGEHPQFPAYLASLETSPDADPGRSLDSLDVSPRILMKLGRIVLGSETTNEYITRIEEVQKFSVLDLHCRNFSSYAITEIRLALLAIGLHLREDNGWRPKPTKSAKVAEIYKRYNVSPHLYSSQQ